MGWKILTFVFGWLLCGAWAIRMDEKANKEVNVWLYYICGLIGLVITWFSIWPKRLWKFAKGVAEAWRQALTQNNTEAKE